MIRAVEAVKERLMRATGALNRAGVPYAVVGGNAVASWVSRVDPAAIRNTRDVDIVLRRSDLDRATMALVAAGFVRHEVSGVEMFLDGPDASPRDAVHIIFAGELVKEGELAPTPDVSDSQESSGFRLMNLEPLVLMKLTSYRLKDRVHLQDLISIGLIDNSWLMRFPAELATRLKQLIDDPTTYDI
jgi:hypothetical protein